MTVSEQALKWLIRIAKRGHWPANPVTNSKTGRELIAAGLVEISDPPVPYIPTAEITEAGHTRAAEALADQHERKLTPAQRRDLIALLDGAAISIRVARGLEQRGLFCRSPTDGIRRREVWMHTRAGRVLAHRLKEQEGQADAHD